MTRNETLKTLKEKKQLLIFRKAWRQWVKENPIQHYWAVMNAFRQMKINKDIRRVEQIKAKINDTRNN